MIQSTSDPASLIQIHGGMPGRRRRQRSWAARELTEMVEGVVVEVGTGEDEAGRESAERGGRLNFVENSDGGLQ